MAEYLNVYVGSYNELSAEKKQVFDRIKEIEEITPLGSQNTVDSDVKLIVKTKEGLRYETTVRSQTIDSWLNVKYNMLLTEEISSDRGLDGEYTTPEERNPTVIQLLSNIVTMNINTQSAKKLE